MNKLCNRLLHNCPGGITSAFWMVLTEALPEALTGQLPTIEMLEQEPSEGSERE